MREEGRGWWWSEFKFVVDVSAENLRENLEVPQHVI